MRLPLLALVLAIASCAPAPRAPSAAGPSKTTTTSAATPAVVALHKLFDEAWDDDMREWPTVASVLGDHRFDDRWPDVSAAGFARRHEHDLAFLARVRAIPREQLDARDALNRDLFERKYAEDVEGWTYQLHHLALDQRGGVQHAEEVAEQLPFASTKDYEAWLHRLEAVPVYVDQTTALLREGAKLRIVQPKVEMQRVAAQIETQLVGDPEKSPFYAPFTRFPAAVPEADRARLSAAARKAIAQQIVPAYRAFAKFFAAEYLPSCFDRAGIWQMPRGAETYAYLARVYTTTTLTPQQIHELGLKEVARIRAAMQATMEKVGFRGTLKDFFAKLRTDPQFFYTSPDDLLTAYRALAKRVDPQLVKLFKTLPRTPYGVEPVPMKLAPDTTTAYYDPSAADGSRAGIYRVNLYKPEQRPKWEMPALTLHESVPGHHLQIALAQEQGELPMFRRNAGYTAFVEGWGLYAESLGEEIGMYDDPYAKFGQLAYEMWRAIRLVVDTGMHVFQWDRQKAIDYFLDNDPKAPLDVTNEIDRYVVWPGQALAYKIGELKLKELRARAKTALGDRFDVRTFHDVALAQGAVPLDVLERHVDEWIASRKGER